MDHDGTMLSYFASFFVMLGGLSANPTSAWLGVGTVESDIEAGPPEDMIDFLGRRKECDDLPPKPGEVLPAPPPGSWREWLRCESLSAEEQALRLRYGSDTRAIAFLDQTPSDFRSEVITVHTYDGPPPARAEHVEQRGVDTNGRTSWRMVLDREAAQGLWTALTVSWGSYPSRTIYLDNQMFPWLDLTSAWVAIRESPYEALNIELRYGSVRGWCGDADRDDRSRVSVSFRAENVEVFRQERTNCNSNYEELQASAFTAPPPARQP